VGIAYSIKARVVSGYSGGGRAGITPASRYRFGRWLLKNRLRSVPGFGFWVYPARRRGISGYTAMRLPMQRCVGNRTPVEPEIPRLRAG